MLKKRNVYWEYKDDTSNKFWAANIIKEDGKYILIRKWGRIGTEGQSMEQRFDDRVKAIQTLGKLIFIKEKEGYKAIF